MKWIETAGGPFVFVARADVSSWTGYEGDYELACEVEGVTGVINFGGSGYDRSAFVLWGEPLRTAYASDYQAFVQWMYADSEHELLSMVERKFPLATWELGPLLEIHDEMILFDAAIPGSELSVDDSLEIQLQPGVYRVQTADIVPGGHHAARVHQLIREKM